MKEIGCSIRLFINFNAYSAFALIPAIMYYTKYYSISFASSYCAICVIFILCIAECKNYGVFLEKHGLIIFTNIGNQESKNHSGEYIFNLIVNLRCTAFQQKRFVMIV